MACEKCPVKVLIYSALMCIGLIISQTHGGTPKDDDHFSYMVRLPCNIALSFIIINVGLEFDIVKSRLASYTVDYIVATLAAVCPMVLVFLYFKFVVGNPTLASMGFALEPSITTTQALLLSVFAGPTSAGMLLTLLGAAKLNGTWIYTKASMLAILDDIDSLVFIAFMRILAVPGAEFQLTHFGPIIVTVGLLLLAWFNNHKFEIPHSWPFLVGYAVIIGASLWCLEGVHRAFPTSPWIFDIAVLIPSFTLGCLTHDENLETCQERPKLEQRPRSQEMKEREERIASYGEYVDTFMGCSFMFCVGLSMPTFSGLEEIGTGTIIFHVAMINLVMLLGKFVIMFFYGADADLKQRWGLSLAMCPRGEIGAAVIIITIQTVGNRINPAYLGIAALSVIGNLVFSTGLIVYVVKIATSVLRAAGAGEYQQLKASA